MDYPGYRPEDIGYPIGHRIDGYVPQPAVSDHHVVIHCECGFDTATWPSRSEARNEHDRHVTAVT